MDEDNHKACSCPFCDMDLLPCGDMMYASAHILGKNSKAECWAKHKYEEGLEMKTPLFGSEVSQATAEMVAEEA